MELSDLLRRLDELIENGNRVLATSYSNHAPGVVPQKVLREVMAGFRTASLSFIARVYGETHIHYTEFNCETAGSYADSAKCGIAILQAIQSEIRGGWLFTVKGLIAAELFSDFLEMAEHLLESGYKDPAAVMVGSVLEEHLRQLCGKHGIPTEDDRNGKSVPRKADGLNAELAKHEVYTKLYQKLITAWLDLRNKAAHGKYDQYSEDQVRDLLSGVTGFMANVSL